jgi:hypothetical protein
VEDTEPEFTALEASVTKVLQLLITRQQPRLLNVNLPLNAKGVSGLASPLGIMMAKSSQIKTLGAFSFLFAMQLTV